MSVKIALLNKSKKSKLGKFINDTPSLSNFPMVKFDRRTEKKNYKVANYSTFIQPLLIKEQEYIVTGRVTLEVMNNGVKKITVRKFQLPFKAKSNLSDRKLFNVVGHKLQEFYDLPRFGNSVQSVKKFSMNILNIPNNFNFPKRAKIYKSSNLELRLFNSLSEDIEIKENCVIDYMYNELQKIRKKTKLNKLIDQFKKYGYKHDGVTIQMFKNVVDNHYKSYDYVIIGPDYNIIERKKLLKRCKHTFMFYVNNKHLYPLNDATVQKSLKLQESLGRKDFYNYFQDTELSIYNDIVYMENIDCKYEDKKIYVLNKDIDIDQYCIDLIEKTNHGIEYIELDHKTGHIQQFKHPTKDCIITEYADYHRREKLVSKINKKYLNLFMNFRNQSYATISLSLLKMIDDIPSSYYRNDTLDYLNKYEPKPIVDILKTCNKEDVLQIDFYKQYSSIFAIDYQKEGFYIPVYDFFNTVEEYDDEDIELGEYFVKQKTYKGVKLFGSFIHYYIVKELMKRKIITKDDITYCINSKRRFKPECFKKYVDLTAENCDEIEFKKLNNWLNGMLKGTKRINSKCYFTDDVNVLAHIISNNGDNSKMSWTHNEKTGYNFVKTYEEETLNYNTSSFYRATLSCSILQTVDLIDKCSECGTIAKVLTDAVYFIPKQNCSEAYNLCPKKEDGILPNLGKYFYDFSSDLIENRASDITFEFKDIVKNGEYIAGGGGLGKSYMVISELKERVNDKILFVSTTNKAVIELQDKIINIIGYLPENWDINTFAWCKTRFRLNSIATWQSFLSNYKLICNDEAPMNSHEYMRALELSDTPKLYLGDVNQLPAINGARDEMVDLDKYFTKYYNKREKKFVEGKARYDKKTYKLISKFLKTSKTKKLKEKFNEIDDSKIYKFYIVSTRKSRNAYNTKCCNHFHKHEKTKFYFKESDQKYYIGENMPIVCIKNDDFKKIDNIKHTYGISNNWIGKLIKIGEKTVTIKGPAYTNPESGELKDMCVKITKKRFETLFLPMYAATCHKFQGAKIEDEFAIIETKRDYYYKDEDKKWVKGERKLCTKNMFYTAITRTTNYKYIHIYKDNRCDDKFYPVEFISDFIKMNTEHKLYYVYKKEVERDVKQHDGSYKLQKVIDYDISDVEKDGDFQFQYIGTKQIIGKMIKNLGDTKIVKITKQVIKPKKIFKPKKEQSLVNDSKLYITQSAIRLVYYDSSNIRKQKKFTKTKNRSLKEAFEMTKKLAKDMDIEPKIVDNKKLLLSFD